MRQAAIPQLLVRMNGDGSGAALLAVCAIVPAASCLPVWRTLVSIPAAILRDE